MSIAYDSKIVVSRYEHLHGRLVCYMRPRVEGRSENEAQPSQLGLRVAELVLKLHREEARRLIALGGPPVDQISFWDREEDVDWGGLPLQRRERFLKEVDIRSIGGRGHGDSKVVNVGHSE